MKVFNDETLALIARRTAYECRTDNPYLPQTLDERIRFQPHAWVIAAIRSAQQAMLDEVKQVFRVEKFSTLEPVRELAPDDQAKICEIAEYVGMDQDQINRFTGALKLCGYAIKKKTVTEDLK